MLLALTVLLEQVQLVLQEQLVLLVIKAIQEVQVLQVAEQQVLQVLQVLLALTVLLDFKEVQVLPD